MKSYHQEFPECFREQQQEEEEEEEAAAAAGPSCGRKKLHDHDSSQALAGAKRITSAFRSEVPKAFKSLLELSENFAKFWNAHRNAGSPSSHSLPDGLCQNKGQQLQYRPNQ